MPKPATRVYPTQILLRDWRRPAGAPGGVWEQPLARDEASGAITRLIRVEARSEAAALPPGAGHDRWSELYVLDGDLVVDGAPAGTYLCRPPGAAPGSLRVARDALCLDVQHAYVQPRDAHTVRLSPAQVQSMPWTRPPGSSEAFGEKVLMRDAETASHTRLVRAQPGVDSQVYAHPFAEEAYILDGGYQVGDEYHPAGTYTCLPPGTRHGPFVSIEGYLVLQFRYYD